MSDADGPPAQRALPPITCRVLSVALYPSLVTADSAPRGGASLARRRSVGAGTSLDEANEQTAEQNCLFGNRQTNAHLWVRLFGHRQNSGHPEREEIPFRPLLRNGA